jgi:hypothetical protein
MTKTVPPQNSFKIDNLFPPVKLVIKAWYKNMSVSVKKEMDKLHDKYSRELANHSEYSKQYRQLMANITALTKHEKWAETIKKWEVREKQFNKEIKSAMYHVNQFKLLKTAQDKHHALKHLENCYQIKQSVLKQVGNGLTTPKWVTYNGADIIGYIREVLKEPDLYPRWLAKMYDKKEALIEKATAAMKAASIGFIPVASPVATVNIPTELPFAEAIELEKKCLEERSKYIASININKAVAALESTYKL